MDYRKYIPHPQNHEGEHYDTFELMIESRPDVRKSEDDKERTAYHVE